VETEFNDQSPASLTHAILANFNGDQNNSHSLTSLSRLENVEYEPCLLSQSYYYSLDQLIKTKSKLANSFNILSLNAQSISAKFEEIKILLQTLSDNNIYFDALCFQETWLGKDADTSLLSLNGYNNIFQAKHCSEHGGLAIFIKDEYDFSPLPSQLSSPLWEGQLCKVKISNCQQIILGNIYRPPRNNREEIASFLNSFCEMISKINQSKCDTILAGDYNFDLIKHDANVPTKQFIDLITSSGFSPKITIPTRFGNKSATLLDNFFLKSNTQNLNSLAGVMLDQISDHQTCFLAYHKIKYDVYRGKKKTVIKRSDNFFEDVSNEINTEDIMSVITEEHDVNTNCATLVDILKQAVDKFTTISTCKVNKYKHKLSPWITFGIMRSIRTRDRLYRKIKKSKPGSNEYELMNSNLKIYNQVLQKTIREARRLFHHGQFEESKNDARKTWKAINSVFNRNRVDEKLPEFIKIDDEKIEQPQANTLLNTLNMHFASIGSKLSETITTSAENSIESYLNSIDQRVDAFHFELISVEHIEKIIDELQPKNSCASDGISTKLVKALKNKISKPMTFIINQCFQTGCFPNILKIAKVKSLFKKGDPHDPNNYRPISILPSLSKIIEKVMQKQIVRYFESNEMFYENQYGFRAKHSTELAVVELVDRLSTAMDRGEIPISIFIDLSKAFDCLNHSILLKKLSHYGFNEQALNLMKNYLKDRKQYIESSGYTSIMMDIDTGVPQGSILGPLLFLIYINDFSKASEHFDMINFADDTALVSNLRTTTNLTSQKIESELNKVSDWLKVNKLSINVKKTKAMVFHSARKKVTTPTIKLHNEQIEFVDSLSYLGIVLDRHLSWKEHVDSTASKISKTIGALCKLKHFLPQNTLKLIYDSLIHCKIKYGILVWGENSNRIMNLQKKAIRIISKSRYNSHCDPIFKKLEILKVHDTKRLQELIFFYKFRNNSLPKYFQQNFFTIASSSTRSTRNSNLLIYPRFQHEYMRKHLKYSIVKTVNESPSIITEKVGTHSLNGYARYIKNYILTRYSSVCNIDNCYVCNNRSS
jgi:exonuclease III